MLEIFKVDDVYKRFSEIKREEVLKFQQWIQTQPHIPDLTEHDALLFYYASKCSMEYSKQILDNYLTYRTHVAEFFADLDVERNDMKHAMNILSVCPIPKTTTDGYGVMILKLLDKNLNRFNCGVVIKLVLLTMDIWIQEVGVLPGLIFVIDLKGVQLGHIARVGLLQMKKFLFYLQEAIPVRMHGFHFINLVPFMDKLLGLMTPFMKKELMNVLHIHSTIEDFYKFVPRDMLPKENGGELMESKDLREIFYDKLRNNRNEILEFERNHVIDEAKRPGKAKNASSLFGVEGNFKKLDID